MPGLPTSGLKDLGYCVEAQQFDRAMLEELFVIADAMAEVRPGSCLLYTSDAADE